jgi:hypothetical protein
MTDTSNTTASLKACARSRIANGSAVLDGVDGRTAAGRRYRDVLDGLVTEHDIRGESDMHLAREAARLSVWLEGEAARAARGESVDMGASVTAGNLLRRILSDLRGPRRPSRRNFPGAAA